MTIAMGESHQRLMHRSRVIFEQLQKLPPEERLTIIDAVSSQLVETFSVSKASVEASCQQAIEKYSKAKLGLQQGTAIFSIVETSLVCLELLNAPRGLSQVQQRENMEQLTDLVKLMSENSSAKAQLLRQQIVALPQTRDAFSSREE